MAHHGTRVIILFVFVFAGPTSYSLEGSREISGMARMVKIYSDRKHNVRGKFGNVENAVGTALASIVNMVGTRTKILATLSVLCT